MLGLVATGKRNIRSGSQYDKFFTEHPEGNEVELREDGDVYDTLKLMRKIVNDTLSQTKAIAKELEGSSREETARNIWNFLYHHVQYKKDNPMREQLRTPARSWKDRKKGVDCDCYSIFISSILTNLGIPHAFRMAGYKKDFQHVYVVVPRNGTTIGARNTVWVIDPVVDRFNHEVPFTKKHDQKMAKVTMLNGPEDDQRKCLEKQAQQAPKLRKFVEVQQVIDAGNLPANYFLSKHKIPYVPVFNDETQQAAYIINTPIGKKQVPTVITKDEAQNILNLLATPAEAIPVTSDTTLPAMQAASILGNKIPWWWIAVGGAALWMLSSSGESKPMNGVVAEPVLDGPHKAKKKKKHTSSKSKKYPTITL